MKILIVGLGSIGQRHARSLRELLGSDVELLAFRQTYRRLEISDSLEARPDVDLEALYGITAYDSLANALAEGPTATLVCTPNHLHLPIALEAARAGSHLFIEKPVAHRLAGLEELQREVRKLDLVCMVGYHLRFHPALDRLRALCRDGALGTLLSCWFDFGEHMPFWHRYEDYSQTFMAREEQGGGVVMTQIHDLDAIYSLFGLPETVYATGGRSGALDIDAEDHVTAILSYQSSSAPFSVVLNQDCLRYPPVRMYSIRGTKGCVEWDYYANVVSLTDFDGRPRTLYSDPSLQRNTLFLAEMEHFLNCIHKREQPRVPLHEGIDSLRMALSIKESLKTGRRVSLCELDDSWKS